MLQPTKALSWVKAKFSPGIKTKEADPEELQKLLWTEVEASLRSGSIAGDQRVEASSSFAWRSKLWPPNLLPVIG